MAVRIPIYTHPTRLSPGRHCWCRGQAAGELALIGLPLMILIFATIGLGMMIYSYSFVCTAARDANRYAIVHGASSTSPVSQSDLATYVQNEAQGIQANQLNVSATWTPDNKPGSVVAVSVTYNFQPLHILTGLTLPLTSSAKMVISR